MTDTDIETRLAISAGTKGKLLSGYAARFDSPTTIAGEFIETIAPGAFAKSLASMDVLALFNHDYGRVLGRKSAGTLKIGEDASGLWVEINPPDSPDGWSARELIGRRDVVGMSFGFRTRKDEWDDTGDLPKRTLREVDLYEVTITPIPAYADTTIALRSLEDARKETNASNAAMRVKRKALAEMKFRGLA